MTLPLAPSQGVHESRAVTKDYLRLEMLIQKVVSPYLGTYGLCSSEGPFTHSCVLGRGRLGLGGSRVTLDPSTSAQGPGPPSGQAVRWALSPWRWAAWGRFFKG